MDSIVHFEIILNTESTHFPLLLRMIKINHYTHIQDYNVDYIYYDLNRNNCDEFCKCLHENVIQGMFDKIEVLLSDNSSDINNIVNEFEQAIDYGCVHFKKQKRKYNQKHNLWFDKQCRQAKRESQKCLRKFRQSRCVYNLNVYLSSKRKYKDICKQKRLLYNRRFVSRVDSSVNESRSFWREIKRVFNKPKSEPNILLDDWYNHFSKLFSNQDVNAKNEENLFEDIDIEREYDDIEYSIFNADITDDEILKSVQTLKVNKASSGLIVPEQLVYGIRILLPYIRKLFNRLFKFGDFPDTWAKSIIIPIYKKGNRDNPNNYRGIALLDVLSKVYITIITKRLTFYVEIYSKLCESQAGFRAGYSTVDNAFVLYSIVAKYFTMKGRSIYVAFVDFQKAFDSVNHSKLYDILRKNGIKGNLYKTIQKIYCSVKSCVRVNGNMSGTFNCPVGLRQGCSLSPILFALFINELHTLLEDNNTRGIQLFPDIVEVFTLMFADDIALISDTVVGLQKQLNILNQFCEHSKLAVNILKTKVLVFKRGGQLASKEKWTYGGTQLETVNGFIYVGIYFTNRLSMYKMAEAMCTKAKKVLLYIFSSLQDVPCLPYKTFFKIFDSKIASIILYGSELWGLHDTQCIETIQLCACKRFLNVNTSSCNDAILGDLGRFPMQIFAAKRCVKYWIRLISLPKDRYIRLCYEMLLHYDQLGYRNWVSCIRVNLYKHGFGYIWESQSVPNPKTFVIQYVQTLKDEFLQNWHSRCIDNVKLNHYFMYKTNFQVEKYVTAIDIDKCRKCFVSLRSSSHCGRHFNIEREHRLCPYCETVLEDEFHFIITCPLYANTRSIYIPLYYYQYPLVEKFYQLMSTENVTLIRKLAMYIHNALRERDIFLKSFE